MSHKTIILAFMVLVGLTGGAFAEDAYKNYEITIDGKTYDINLDEDFKVTGRSGATVNAILRKRAISQYTDTLVSFQHKSDLGVSSDTLDPGIIQHTISTSTGSLIILQEYTVLDASTLVSFMLDELNKDAVASGFQITQKSTTRKIASGQTLRGLKATLKKGEEEMTTEVFAYAGRGQSVLIVTQIDKEFYNQDKHLIETFWETFKVKF